MTWSSVWALGAVDTSVEVGRLLAYVATSGASGIVGPTDLAVKELSTPSTSIRVMAGAGVIASSYPSAGAQSYAARNPDQDVVDVTATGSGSGRSDLVVARVLDSAYSGVSADKVETHIVTDVPTDTQGVQDAIDAGATGLDAAIALARLDIPSSTATITQDMITDLRNVAVPRRERFQHILHPQTDSHKLTSSSYVVYPSDAHWNIHEPYWATEVRLTVMLSGARSIGNVWGFLRTHVGSSYPNGGAPTTATFFDTSNVGNSTITIVNAGVISLSAPYEDRDRTIWVMAEKQGGSGHLEVGTYSTLVIDGEFVGGPG
jgi:hypothetical protein